MKLGTVFRPTRATNDPTDPARAEHERQVREARLELARRKPNWTEIPETRLVRRGPFLVDAETDLVHLIRRGHVFGPGTASLEFVSPSTPLTYYVGQDGHLVFLREHGRTWSEIVARKARRGNAT